MEPDRRYTTVDHFARDDDAYALAKYRISLTWMRKYGADSGARVLNVGAGSGVFSRMCSEAGYSVTSIEPDDDAADIAELSLGKGAVIRTGLLEYEVNGNPDVVVMHDVLEHIGDDRKALEKIHQVANGYSRPTLLIVSVPAWQWLYGYHDRQLGHYRRYSPRSLCAVVEQYFDILEVRQLGVLGIPAALWYSRLWHKQYPVGSGGRAESVFAAVCRIEERIPLPFGTSILLAAKARQV